MDSSSGCATSNSTFVLVLAFSACVEEETSHKRNQFDVRQRPRPSSKDRTETETSLEFGMREGNMNVASIFTLGIGKGTKQDGRETQQAYHRKRYCNSKRHPSQHYCRPYCKGKLVQRKKSPGACNNNNRWFSEPLQALTIRLFLRRRVLAWIRACNDKRLLSEALELLTLMLSLLFLL
jgi:hypothetical protein